VKTADGFWAGKKPFFVTGGSVVQAARRLPSALARGARKFAFVDDLSSGHLDNIRQHLGAGRSIFCKPICGNPAWPGPRCRTSIPVFHLAADHGGRGFVDLHQAAPRRIFSLDGLVFAEALKANVKKCVFASSGCVYPNFLQSDTKKELYLTEDSPKAQMMPTIPTLGQVDGEFTLQLYAKEHGMGAASCRLLHGVCPPGSRITPSSP